jgi:hypothetical protein
VNIQRTVAITYAAVSSLATTARRQTGAVNNQAHSKKRSREAVSAKQHKTGVLGVSDSARARARGTPFRPIIRSPRRRDPSHCPWTPAFERGAVRFVSGSLALFCHHRGARGRRDAEQQKTPHTCRAGVARHGTRRAAAGRGRGRITCVYRQEVGRCVGARRGERRLALQAVRAGGSGGAATAQVRQGAGRLTGCEEGRAAGRASRKPVRRE